MKIPNQIVVGNEVWDIGLCPLERDEGRNGGTFLEKRVIKIDPNNHEANQFQTLIHELMHVAAYYAGTKNNEDKFTEEQWITKIAPLYTMILTQNYNNLFNLKEDGHKPLNPKNNE